MWWRDILLESKNKLVLLEEPELSLHESIIEQLAPTLANLQENNQIIITSHSTTLLHKDLDPKDIFILTPEDHGTTIKHPTEDKDIKGLYDEGVPLNQTLTSLTSPKDIQKLPLFASYD